MEVAIRLIKLKPGTQPAVDEWTKTMNARKPEAIQTIRDEGIEIESWFSVSIEDSDYLIGYIRAKSLKKAKEIYDQSTHPIDEIHQKFKSDTWIQGDRPMAKLLLDLTVDH